MVYHYHLKGYITETITRTRNVMLSHDYFATLLQQETLLVCGNNNVSHMNNYFSLASLGFSSNFFGKEEIERQRAYFKRDFFKLLYIFIIHSFIFNKGVS